RLVAVISAVGTAFVTLPLVPDALKSVNTWITFAGCILVVGVLFLAQAILVPVCLAILITFVLTPPGAWRQRRIGVVAAVLTSVILVFTSLGLAGYGVYRQMATMVDTLPRYAANVRAKVEALRSGEPVKKLEETLEGITNNVEGAGSGRRGT